MSFSEEGVFLLKSDKKSKRMIILRISRTDAKIDPFKNLDSARISRRPRHINTPTPSKTPSYYNYREFKNETSGAIFDRGSISLVEKN